MKSVYIETTVVSYYTARPSRDLVVAAREEASRQVWPLLESEYDSFVSALVREEAGRGDVEQASLRLRDRPVPGSGRGRGGTSTRR